MEETLIPPAEETPAEETPAEETPAEETPAEETPADNNLQKLLDDLKNDFTAKMAAQAANYEKQIKERDAYIKTLLSPTAKENNNALSVAEQLNAKRDFKKW